MKFCFVLVCYSLDVTMMNSFSLTLLDINKIVAPITTPLKSNRIEEIVQEWYANFVNVDQTLLFELVTAANFMDIKALLDLTCLAVSILIKVSYSTRYFDILIRRLIFIHPIGCIIRSHGTLLTG